jgi:TRAP-type C4-dicarboxylate transport system permease small subunit
MKLYSDFPARRTAQIVADLIALGLIAVFVWTGVLVYGAIAVLAAFGKTIEDAGDGFEKTMADAGDTLGGVPLIGGGIRQPFDAASGAGTLLAQAGQAQQDLVMTVALVIGIVVAAIPILLVLWIWLRRRGRWARRATEARNLSRMPDGPDLLALRALVNADFRDLHDIHGEPVDAWRRGEKKVVRALAQLELREAGVRLR